MAKSDIKDFAQQLYEEATHIAQESGFDRSPKNDTSSSTTPMLSQESIDAFRALSDSDKKEVWNFFAGQGNGRHARDQHECLILHASVAKELLAAMRKSYCVRCVVSLYRIRHGVMQLLR